MSTVFSAKDAKLVTYAALQALRVQRAKVIRAEADRVGESIRATASRGYNLFAIKSADISYDAELLLNQDGYEITHEGEFTIISW